MISKDNSLSKKTIDSHIIIVEKSPSKYDNEDKFNLQSYSNNISNSLSNKINEQRKSMTKYLFKSNNLEKLQQLDNYSPVKKREDSKLIEEEIMDKIELMKVIGLQKVRFSQGNIENSQFLNVNLNPVKHHSSNYVLKSHLSSSNSIDFSFSENDTINLTNSLFANGLSNNDISQSNSFKKLMKLKESKDEEKKHHEGSIINEEQEEHSNHSNDNAIDNASTNQVLKYINKKVKFKNEPTESKKLNSNTSDPNAVSSLIESDQDTENENDNDIKANFKNKIFNKDEKTKNLPIVSSEEEVTDVIKHESNLTVSPINNNINVTLNTTNIYLNQTNEGKLKHKEDMAILQKLINLSLSKDLSKLANSSQLSNEVSSDCKINIENVLKQWQYGDMIKQPFNLFKDKRNSKTDELSSKIENNSSNNNKKLKTENIEKSFRIKLIDISPDRALKDKNPSSIQKNSLPNQINSNFGLKIEEQRVLKGNRDILSEDETFFRFNKKGWICNYCANFNYESK